MLRKITWRFWAGLAAGLVAYGAIGWWWSSDGTTEAWLYRVGLTAATVLPLAFAVVYGIHAKFWRNEVGTAVVLAALSIVPTVAPLAYVFWFNGGQLTTSWLAWLAVSGPALSAIALAWMCWIWLRIGREGGGDGDGIPG